MRQHVRSIPYHEYLNICASVRGAYGPEEFIRVPPIGDVFSFRGEELIYIQRPSRISSAEVNFLLGKPDKWKSRVERMCSWTA